MGAEYAVAKSRGKANYYRFEDAIASLACGISQQVTALFLVGAIVGGYVWVFGWSRRLGLAAMPDYWAWIIGFMGVDFAYYLFHRASHRVNILWATHVVHHHSEEYNLSTALRQGSLQGLATAPFYWPLALVGVPPMIFLGCVTINTLYQFWIHTRLVGKLPFGLELWLNTPSHHRVHHGIDPTYIDKNYAGVFIIWDRLFGTFKEEKSEPNYGTVKPLASWNPLWANVHYFVELWQQSARTKKWSDKIKLWFAPPEWRPQDLGGKHQIPKVNRKQRQLYNKTGSISVRRFVAVEFVLVTAATVMFLLLQNQKTTAQMAPLALWIVATVLGWAGLFEGKKWVRPLNGVRVPLLGVAILVLLS